MRRLLVVDDEVDFCEFVRKVGEMNDFEVTTLADAKPFQETYRKIKPLRIVLDIVMPGLDGFDLTKGTFDSNAERALEVGWHLHGENYARGAFMVRMRQLLAQHGVEERTELPDHVSHVLPVLARADDELRVALARGVLLPALEKIAAGFGDGDNPYLGVVTGLKKYIESTCDAGESRNAE